MIPFFTKIFFNYEKQFLRPRKVLMPLLKYSTVADHHFERNVKTHEYKLEIRHFPLSKYGGSYIITCMYSTGVGLKFFNAIRRVLEHIGAPIFFETFSVPHQGIRDYVIDEIVQSIVRNRIAFKTNFDRGKQGFGVGSMAYANKYITNSLDLYVSVLKFQTFKGIKTKYDNVDMHVLYQNKMGDFSNLEYEPVKGVVESIRVSYLPLMERLLDYTCQYAVKNGRKRVTIINKMVEPIELSESMFIEALCKVQTTYPQLKFEPMSVNSMIRKIMTDPSFFDVICISERYATALASTMCGICGGKGLFMGATYNENLAIFEPAEIKLELGEKLARLSSPIAAFAAMTAALDYLGLESYAKEINDAIWKTTLVDNIRTLDLGGKSSMRQVCDQIMRNIDASKKCFDTDSGDEFSEDEGRNRKDGRPC